MGELSTSRMGLAHSLGVPSFPVSVPSRCSATTSTATSTSSMAGMSGGTSTATVCSSSVDDELDWRIELLRERDMLERLMAYATVITAERIPYYIVDPMLGVDRSDRVRRDEQQDEP